MPRKQGVCAFGARVVKAAHDYRRVERRTAEKKPRLANTSALKDARAVARKRDLPEHHTVLHAIITVAAAFETVQQA